MGNLCCVAGGRWQLDGYPTLCLLSHSSTGVVRVVTCSPISMYSTESIQLQTFFPSPLNVRFARGPNELIVSVISFLSLRNFE